MKYYDENGEPISIPTRWEICGCCGGEGGHSQHLGIINTEDWDDEELDDYFRGAYDRVCEECEGTGKVRVPDYDAMSPALRKLVETQDEEWACYQAEVAAERRMGC